MILQPDHWHLLSQNLGKDDHQVKHLTLCNIHLDDQNVESFSKVVAKVILLYKYKMHKFLILCFQVDDVVLSGVGNCGHYNTYSSYPDMNLQLWDCLKESIYKICKVLRFMKTHGKHNFIILYIVSEQHY